MNETSEYPDILQVLAMAKQAGASDLHLSLGQPPNIRVQGNLSPLGLPPLDAETIRELSLSMLTETQRAKFEAEMDLDFSAEIESVGRIRGNVHYSKGAIEAAYRFISPLIPSLEKLGHHPTVSRLCDHHEGLVLITGATGSGKSTTLCAMLEHINQHRSGVVVVLEDPIEFVFQHGQSVIRQRQVGADTHTFASAIKSALRQDADVIVVSELRDLETMRTALTAAETGHLVISTLHTHDAPSTILRILDAFPEEQQDFVASQLASSLRGVICQSLIVRRDQPGRVMASEVMVGNSAIAACIRSKRLTQLPNLIQIGGIDGMHTIDDSLIHLAKHGFITVEDALIRARDAKFVEMNCANYR